MPSRVEIHNDKVVADNLMKIAEDLHGREMIRGMRRIVLTVLADAKRNAPVDTGRLRSGLNASVERGSFKGIGVQGIVGVSSNVEYAPYMENGTGIFAGNARHKFPPPSAFEGWAKRHNMNAFLVARAIYRAGGLKPRHFLKNALEKHEKNIHKTIGNTIKIIIRNHGFG